MLGPHRTTRVTQVQAFEYQSTPMQPILYVSTNNIEFVSRLLPLSLALVRQSTATNEIVLVQIGTRINVRQTFTWARSSAWFGSHCDHNPRPSLHCALDHFINKYVNVTRSSAFLALPPFFLNCSVLSRCDSPV